jgi:IclR family KDG regulon transcriptional repressor
MSEERGSSLRRAVSLLIALGSDEALAEGGFGVSQLAELVEQDKSQVSRTLQVLAEEGFVDRDPLTLAYRLGWRVFTLASAAGDRHLLDAATPVLRALVAELGERSHLSVLQGSRVMTVLTDSPARAVQTAGWVGRPVPVWCTSSGRALLVDHDRETLAELLTDEVLVAGPRAPATVDELNARIAAARDAGYALVDEEFEAGLVAAAAPVRDFRNRVVAAINVSGPKFRLGDRLELAGEAVRAAADEVSRRLGWTLRRPEMDTTPSIPTAR